MIPTDNLWGFLGPFLPMLAQWIRERTGKLGEGKEEAVKALQAAALQTNLYEASLTQGNGRTLEQERELVTLWSTTARSFYRLDPDLAERLQLKAEYWTNPVAWVPEQVHSARISLQQITELTRQLLREG